MATVEEATRLAIRSFANLVGMDVHPETKVHIALGDLADWRDSNPRPSDGEEAMARLPFALWNGYERFDVRDLAKLDKQRRWEALDAIAKWVEATAGARP